ncbi:MAG: VCBS repeat-containing protein [Cyanobacteria bacterium P01_D01_bin.116]
MFSTEKLYGVSGNALETGYTSISNNTFDDKTPFDSDLILQGSSEWLSNENEFVTLNQSSSSNGVFSDAEVEIDFNGDGKNDKFWRNTQTGETAIWLMDGINPNAETLQQVDASWDVGFADFNSDNKTDIFWRNQASGENVVWQMDGTNINSEETIQKIDSNWTFSIAEFNGDRKSDILWRNIETGENAAWIMDGNNVTIAAFLPTTDLIWDYSITDFNNDGKTDVFWRNTVTGENAAWFMDGTNANGFAVQEIDVSWNPTFGDFNGDSRTDILWSNQASGENEVWVMNGTLFSDIIFNEETLDQLSSAWSANVGDFNADGKTDIFWHNTETGENTAWLMNGGNILTKAFLPSNELTWELSFGDFTGNGKTDVFWRNSSTGGTAIWMMDGTIAEGEYLPTNDPGFNVF